MLSIVIPCRDRFALLEATLDSLLIQSSQNFECIVVSDLRDSKSPAQLDRFFKHSEQFKWVSRDGASGGNGARNTGLAAASHDWVVFLDDDDLLASWCIERRIEKLEVSEHLDFFVNPGLKFHKTIEDARAFHRFPLEYGTSDLERMLIHDQPWITTGPTWKKQFLLEIGGWDEKLRFCQDWELNLRALLAEPRYERCIEYDYYWRMPTGKKKSIGATNRSANEIKAIFEASNVLLQSPVLSECAESIKMAVYTNLLKMCRSFRTMLVLQGLLKSSGLKIKLRETGVRDVDPWLVLLLRYLPYLRDSVAIRNALFSKWSKECQFWNYI